MNKMQSYIAPRILRVNGRPAPCKCSENVVCEYCTQANLVLWDRQQHPERKVQEKIISEIEASGVRRTARLLKIQPSTVTRWIQSKKIPSKFIERLKGVA
jgi:hypothetical protein